MPTETEPRVRYRGNVRMWNDGRGYGFIDTDTESEILRAVFVHHTAILMDGHRSLREGQIVEFDIDYDEKDRMIALKVVVL